MAVPQGFDVADNAQRITSFQKKWRTDFHSPAALTDKWDIAQSGSGMTYGVANGILTVNGGTTADDEVSFTSKETFTIAVRSMVALQASQRILGQGASIELVGYDNVSGLPDESNLMGWRLDGTVATNAVYDVATAGQQRVRSPLVTVPTTAAPAWPIFELEAFADEAWFHARSMDNPAARTQSYVRQAQVPDPSRAYKLRLRFRNRQMIGGFSSILAGTGGVIRIVRNGHGLTSGDTVTADNIVGLTGTTFPWTGTVLVVDANQVELNGTVFAGAWVNTGWSIMQRIGAPASSTVWNVNFASVSDYIELTAEITAGRGNNSPGQALGFNLTGYTSPLIVSGLTAENSTTVSNSLKVAGQVRTAVPTPFTTGRLGDLTVSTMGALIQKPFSVPELDWQYAGPIAGLATAADTVAKAAGAAGVRNYVTALQLSNTSATATEFQIKDGAATVIWRTFLPANSAIIDIAFPTPLRGTAAVALNVQAVTAGAVVVANLQGFIAP